MIDELCTENSEENHEESHEELPLQPLGTPEKKTQAQFPVIPSPLTKARPTLKELRTAVNNVHVMGNQEVLQVMFDQLGVFVNLEDQIPLPDSGELRVITLQQVPPQRHSELKTFQEPFQQLSPETPVYQNLVNVQTARDETKTLFPPKDQNMVSKTGESTSEAIPSQIPSARNWPSPYVVPDLASLFPCLVQETQPVTEYESRGIVDCLFNQALPFTLYPTPIQYESIACGLFEKYPSLRAKTTKEYWKCRLRYRYGNYRRRHCSNAVAVKKRKLGGPKKLREDPPDQLNPKSQSERPQASTAPEIRSQETSESLVVSTSLRTNKRKTKQGNATTSADNIHVKHLQQQFKAKSEDGVKLSMEATLEKRRELIQQAESLKVIKQKFPHLFTLKGLQEEFFRLHPRTCIPFKFEKKGLVSGSEGDIVKLIPRRYLEEKSPIHVILGSTFSIRVEDTEIPNIGSPSELLTALFMLHFVFNLRYAKGTEKFFHSLEKQYGLKQ
ncbi:unnamed protein product [Cyprideis torosa]|uniref:Uncharacterized protein n=1 Tax=Cyprideis torosa TaxID=163714 RepID=A0A7R8ZRB8_9CRUS|nr:unnamed protein product [Cyprideis torosa]CAG0893897.1 unnamed protein product [Cyprideis torosa]